MRGSFGFLEINLTKRWPSKDYNRFNFFKRENFATLTEDRKIREK